MGFTRLAVTPRVRAAVPALQLPSAHMTSLARLAILVLFLCAGCLSTVDGMQAAGDVDGGPAVGSQTDGSVGGGGGGGGGGADLGSSSTDLGPLGPLSTTVPPFSGSSHGTGGTMPVVGATVAIPGISYRLIAPSSTGGGPMPFLVFICGVNGCDSMVQTLDYADGISGLEHSVRILAEHTDSAEAIAAAMDDVRAKYDIDNDRTYLESESAGTLSGIALGFQLRQGWFAAYWLNDLVTSGAPQQTAQQLGFAPWGSAGPGGNFGAAMAVVAAMQTAGYRIPDPPYYNGPGAEMHGNGAQGLASLQFFGGKRRR